MREVKSRGRGQADKLIEILPGGRYKRRIGEFPFVYRCPAECVRHTEWGLWARLGGGAVFVRCYLIDICDGWIQTVLHLSGHSVNISITEWLLWSRIPKDSARADSFWVFQFHHFLKTRNRYFINKHRLLLGEVQKQDCLVSFWDNLLACCYWLWNFSW